MTFTEDDLRRMGYVIQDGKAIRPIRAGGDSRLGTDAAPASAVSAPPRDSKPAKYRNTRCEWNGASFDSKAEMEWYRLLVAREQLGEIRNLRRQVPIPLHAPIFDSDGKPTGAIIVVATYVADAVYEERGHEVIADRKSKATRTQVYKLKARWLNLSRGKTIHEVLT